MAKLPTLRGANILYLLTMVLMVVLGSALQAWSLIWGLMLSEVLLILLPGLLYLKLFHMPTREALRLRWPGAGAAALSVLVGVGLSGLAMWLSEILTTILGYTIPLSPSFFPTRPVEAGLFFLSLSVFAPLCEETLFRGVIQRGYEEHYGARTAILVVGVLFAAYHLSVLRMIGIIPVALVLGWVAWRSKSLVSSILVHMSYNAVIGALGIVASMRPDLFSETAGSNLPIAAVGLAVGIGGMWLLGYKMRRREAATEPPAAMPPQEAAPTEPPAEGAAAPKARSSGCLTWLAMAVAAVVFLLLAGSEIVVAKYPQVLAFNQRLQLSALPWDKPVLFRYELRDVLRETVGQAEAQISPQGSGYQVQVATHQQAFEARQGASFYKSDAYEYRATATWARDGLQLTSAEETREGQDYRVAVSRLSGEEALKLQVTESTTSTLDLVLPTDALLEGEWPWRLSAMNLGVGLARMATLASPGQSGEPVQEVYVIVRGAEPLAVPAGNYIAWKVTVGDACTAWYDSSAPYTLLRYDRAGVSYVLSGVE